jgi:hypothetical protein
VGARFFARAAAADRIAQIERKLAVAATGRKPKRARLRRSP